MEALLDGLSQYVPAPDYPKEFAARVFKIGGLYSAVCDALAANEPVPVEYVAVEDVFGEVGPQDYLQKQFRLTAEHIVEKVKAAIARKK